MLIPLGCLCMNKKKKEKVTVLRRGFVSNDIRQRGEGIILPFLFSFLCCSLLFYVV